MPAVVCYCEHKVANPVSRTVIHALLTVILLVASPLRVLCADSCVPGAEVVQLSSDDGPACHEPHDTSPTSDPDPSDDGCRHGDESQARSLRVGHKPVDMAADARTVVHVTPELMHEAASWTPRLSAPAPGLHVALAPLCFLTPLRI